MGGQSGSGSASLTSGSGMNNDTYGVLLSDVVEDDDAIKAESGGSYFPLPCAGIACFYGSSRFRRLFAELLLILRYAMRNGGAGRDCGVLRDCLQNGRH